MAMLMTNNNQKKYKSCTAPLGEYCSKHGVVHRKEKEVITIPAEDGTGPLGKGKKTGRKLGKC